MKKKKIIISIVSLILIIIVTIFLFFMVQYFIFKKDINDVEMIKIDTGGYLSPTSICEINFLNNSLMYKTEDYNEIETFYTEFTDKDAEYFIKKANLYGFFNWEKSYINNNVYDGYGVTICIKFTDGSVQETHCYADFPPNYDKMAEVFYETFGYNIL